MSKPGLPYRCPTLNCDYLLPPCAGQIAAAKERQRKSPHAVMPYGLEQCLRCMGESLVKQGEATMEYTGDIRPEVTRALVIISETANEVAEIITPPATYPVIPEVQAEEPEMGMAKSFEREQMSAAVARDLKKRGPETKAQDPETKKPTPETMLPDDCPGKAGLTAPVLTCKNHPDRPVKFDSLNRSMGLCQECVTKRGRESGRMSNKHGATAPPFYIPLNQAKYADLKGWLIAQAAENERTLQQQIMFSLKQFASKGRIIFEQRPD